MIGRALARVLRAAWLGAALVAGAAAAQTDGRVAGQIGLTGFAVDETAPVEVTSDRLTVDQSDGSSVFEGDVVISQGALRIAAGLVRIEYLMAADGTPDGIARLIAEGNVTLATAEEAAEAQRAVYDLAAGRIEMTGDVLLTQGGSTLAGQRLVVDVAAGTGTLEGRVRTVIMPRGSDRP